MAAWVAEQFQNFVTNPCQQSFNDFPDPSAMNVNPAGSTTGGVDVFSVRGDTITMQPNNTYREAHLQCGTPHVKWILRLHRLSSPGVCVSGFAFSEDRLRFNILRKSPQNEVHLTMTVHIPWYRVVNCIQFHEEAQQQTLFQQLCGRPGVKDSLTCVDLVLLLDKEMEKRFRRDLLTVHQQRAISDAENLEMFQLGRPSEGGGAALQLCHLLFSVDPAIENGTSLQTDLVLQLRRAIRKSSSLEWPIRCGKNGANPYLLLLNPKAGAGKALALFHAHIHPVFRASGVPYELLITEHRNHALRVISECDVSAYRGLISISGDGLTFEVINGLLQRSDWQSALRSATIGVIGAGSGNALATAILHRIQPVKSSISFVARQGALVLCHAKSTPLDLVMVEYTTPTSASSQTGVGHYGPAHAPHRRTPPPGVAMSGIAQCASFLCITWGLVADIDMDSEALRFLGGRRFTVTGVAKILVSRKYRALLQYFPKRTNTPQNTQSSVVQSEKVRLQSSEDVETEEMESDREMLLFDDAHKSVPSIITPDKIRRCSPAADDVPTEEPYEWRHLPPLWEAIPASESSGWVSRTEQFTSVCAVYQSHLSSTVLAVPQASFADATIYLTVIRAEATRMDLVQMMDAMERGEHLSMPQVELIPVEAFRLTPMDVEGNLCVDGERLPFGPVQAEVWPGATNILTARPELSRNQ